MMKVLFGCGIFAGFRGSSEHTYFNVSQVKTGNYPEQYEDPQLAGKPYVSIDNLSDKTNKLSVHNSYLRNCGTSMRFPVNFDDDENFGAALVRLKQKIGPDQKRMYCQPAPKSYQLSLARMGHYNVHFYANKPLGPKSIAKLFKDGAKHLGLPDSFRPHSLRSALITKLANDPSVSIAETMSAARHTSVSASMNYQRSDGVSEANRLRAIGQLCDSSLSSNKKMKCAGSSNLKVEAMGNLKTTGLEPYDWDMVEASKITSEWTMVDDFDAGETKVQSQVAKKEVDVEDDDYIVLKGRKKEAEVPSMTQVGIEELQDDIDDLKAMMTPPKKSENQKTIALLSAEVRRLKRKLELRDKEWLYQDSLASAIEDEKEDLKYKYEMERKMCERVKRENAEYEQFLESRFPLSRPRRVFPRL